MAILKIGTIHLKEKNTYRPIWGAGQGTNRPVAPFSSSQPRFNTKPEVDYRFPLHFYLLNALSLFCGLLRAIGLRHRGPLISNSVNIEGGTGVGGSESRRQGFFLKHRIKATSDSSISIFLLTTGLSLYSEFSPESTQQAAHTLRHNSRRCLCVYVLLSYYS